MSAIGRVIFWNEFPHESPVGRSHFIPCWDLSGRLVNLYRYDSRGRSAPSKTLLLLLVLPLYGATRPACLGARDIL